LEYFFVTTPRNSSDRILNELKRAGPQTASQLGELLGISSEGARQQLQRLANAGLVTASSQVNGVGRPAQRWQLAECSNRYFPDNHSELSLHLIEGVRQVFGEDGLRQLLENRIACRLQSYRLALEGATTLREKVSRLAQLRSDDGYMARWEEDGEALLLIEDHCPIHCAARACSTLCGSELALFQNLLGQTVRIERGEHLIAGARHCSYRISETAP